MADRTGARTVGVVICTHTEARRSLLHALTRSIAAGTRQPDQVVIVVDRNPALLELLRGDDWPLAVEVMASDGSGLAAARNAGWRALGTGLVAFIDDDAIASPEWLDDLAAALDRLEADVVGGRIDADWVDGTPSWYTRRLGWIVGCSYEGQPTVAQEVRNVIGCNMLMRRSLLEALGGFDATLGRTSGGLAGCEETELCIRATANGGRVMLIPGATVAQVLPADRGQVRYAIRRAWHEGRSKRLLTQLHGQVLGTEASYATGLVSDAARRLGAAVVRRAPVELERAGALLGVLGAAAAGYAAQAAMDWRRSVRPNIHKAADGHVAS
jgi:GT2 family glycosyltransferase